MTTTRNADMLLAALAGEPVAVPPIWRPGRTATTATPIAVPNDAEITDRFGRCTYRGIAVTVWASEGKVWSSLAKGCRVERSVLDHAPHPRPDFATYLSQAIAEIGA